MLAILAFGPLAFLAVSLVISAITTGGTLWYQNKQAEKAKAANDKAMTRQENKAKAAAVQQFNHALAWGRGEGVALMEKKILDEKRELRAKERGYGEPVVS